VAEGEGETFGIDGDMCGDGGSQVGIFEEGDVVAGGFQDTMAVKKSSEEYSELVVVLPKFSSVQFTPLLGPN
jgi:hypothetical protein